jgi:site-specific recombinase XerD
MLEDMRLRQLGRACQTNYVRAVKKFAAFLGRSPETATAEDIRRFQLHQSETGVQPPTFNATVSALRFLFTVTLDRPELARHLTTVRAPRRLPVVLSPEQVGRLIACAPGPGLKYKALFSVTYGAGLRVSEAVSLKLCDIDGPRQTIRIEQGKGRRDRYAMLSPHMLELLRAYWCEARPQAWLFPAPQLRHASVGAEHRHPGDPGSARPCQAGDHSAVCPGRHPHPSRRGEPAGAYC